MRLDIQTSHVDATAVIDEGCLMIDATATTVRTSYLTLSPGQSGVYLRKTVEAQTYKDAGYIGSEHNYPYIMRQAEISGATMRQVAIAILQKGHEVDMADARIEAIRVAGKTQLRAANGSIGEALRARDSVIKALTMLVSQS